MVVMCFGVCLAYFQNRQNAGKVTNIGGVTNIGEVTNTDKVTYTNSRSLNQFLYTEMIDSIMSDSINCLTDFQLQDGYSSLSSHTHTHTHHTLSPPTSSHISVA